MTVARFAIALLTALRGSICLYQGEELGLQEADIAFEDLRDPYGIRFWPGFKGRDGCRTPMVWESQAPYGGFSEAKPWLPVPQSHLAQAVDVNEADEGSLLNHYRAMLKARSQSEALLLGSITFIEGTGPDVLAFVRESASDKRLCVFNFSPAEQGTIVFGKALTVPGFGWAIEPA